MKTNARPHFHLPHLIAAAIAASVVSLTAAHASSPLFSDDFSGVAPSNFPSSEELNADGWYFVGQAQGTPWTIGEDSTAPLIGPSLENPGSSSSWQFAVKQFAPATLSKVGDTLTVQLDYHVASTTDDAHLDVAFLQSANKVESNSFTDQEANPLLNAKGYSVYQASKSIPTTSSFLKIQNAAEEFEGPKTYLHANADPAVLGDSSQAHKLVLSLAKVASGIEITWSIDGVVVANALETESAFDTFDTLRLMGPSDSQTHFDNISVTANIQKP